MKTNLSLSFIIAAIAICVAARGHTSAREVRLFANPNDTTPKSYQLKENPYEGLRQMAFAMTPEKLKLSLPVDKTVVFGIIMDWNISRATVSTVCYQTGDASIYLSTGAVIIGGGMHQSVSDAAKHFVATAQSYIDRSTKTDSTTVPGKDEVKFYLLTNNGVFMAKESMRNIENKSSGWLLMFTEGQNVIGELRKISEKK